MINAEIEKIKHEQNALLPENTIAEFMPHLIEGFVHFYGEDKRSYISSSLNNAYIFTYFNNNPNFEKDAEKQYAKLRKHLHKTLPEHEEEFEEIIEHIKGYVDSKRCQSAAATLLDEDNEGIQILMIEMSKHNFFPRLIHECVHLVDSKFEKSGFSSEDKKATILNEYFTDKIAVDIYNHLLKQGVPLMQNCEPLTRKFSDSGNYYLPNPIMKDFYEQHKKEIINSKFCNSLDVFIKYFGEENTNKIIDGFEFMNKNFHIGMTDEVSEKIFALKDELVKIVNNPLSREPSLEKQ